MKRWVLSTIFENNIRKWSYRNFLKHAFKFRHKTQAPNLGSNAEEVQNHLQSWVHCSSFSTRTKGLFNQHVTSVMQRSTRHNDLAARRNQFLSCCWPIRQSGLSFTSFQHKLERAISFGPVCSSVPSVVKGCVGNIRPPLSLKCTQMDLGWAFCPMCFFAVCRQTCWDNYLPPSYELKVDRAVWQSNQAIHLYGALNLAHGHGWFLFIQIGPKLRAYCIGRLRRWTL